VSVPANLRKPIDLIATLLTCQCTYRCDTQEFVAPNTRPFELPGTLDAAVLCIHGFTSTPFEVRYLAEALQRRGFTALGPLLPGHGTSVGDLAGTTWAQWSGEISSQYEALARRFPWVAVVGQSLGGLLALHLAAHARGVKAVASLAAPLWLDGMGKRVDEWTRPGRWLHRYLRAVPKLGGSDIADPATKASYPSYSQIPVAALHSLCDFMAVVDEELPRIAAPTLVLHARRDHTAPVACAHRIAERTRAERLRLLDDSFHVISVDRERDIVADEVGSFLRRHL
jgi:carboxylesterase